jgi:hypothetical protein
MFALVVSAYRQVVMWIFLVDVLMTYDIAVPDDVSDDTPDWDVVVSTVV